MSEAIATIRHSTIDIRHSKDSTFVIPIRTLACETHCFKVHFKRFPPDFLNHGVEISDTKYGLTNLLKTNKFASSRVPGLVCGSMKGRITIDFRGFRYSQVILLKNYGFPLTWFFAFFIVTLQLQCSYGGPINYTKELYNMTEKVNGSVMVVGGGIAGMQASLDLANSGYLVHLVEKSSAIGGLMSQLDKTFPTNDCAM